MRAISGGGTLASSALRGTRGVRGVRVGEEAGLGHRGAWTRAGVHVRTLGHTGAT